MEIGVQLFQNLDFDHPPLQLCDGEYADTIIGKSNLNFKPWEVFIEMFHQAFKSFLKRT